MDGGRKDAEMRLHEIASLVAVSVKRDGEFNSLGHISHSMPQMLILAETKRWVLASLKNPCVTCLITIPEVAASVPVEYGIAVSDSPRQAFFELHNYLALNTDFYWRDFPSEISPEAHIYPNVYIAPKNVRIGKGTIVEPGVTILERSIIGEQVSLRAGCTIASKGFEFKRLQQTVLSVEHAGGVRLHDRVEVQANCGIDRAIFGGFTEIGEDTKLDNLVHIAHNVRVGKRCLIAANAMVAGSTTIGDDVWIGPSATISNELMIGDRAHITIGSVVARNVGSDESVAGNFAIERRKFLKFFKWVSS